jgi:hypothetical protein
MNTPAVIFAFIAIFSIFMGMYMEKENRKAIAKRLHNLHFKIGPMVYVINHVSDFMIFKLHTICIKYTTPAGRDIKMSLLTLDEALDLLANRTLNRSK